MTRRQLAQVVAFVVVAVFAVGIWSLGDDPQPRWLRFYSVAVLAAVLVLSLWDHWLWRTPLAQRVPSVPRNLRGTWKGTLTTLWKDPSTGASPPPKLAYLVVRQTATKLSVVLLTDESYSRSSLATVTNDGAIVSLDYMYLNFPDAHLEERSRIHHGSASFAVSGRTAERMRGRYWTNRDSRGELDFVERHQKIADDFQAAQDLFD